MEKPAPGARLQVRIDKLAVGGNGVTRADGFVLFVGDVAPGDLAEIEVTETKANHGTAKLVRVLEAGPGRRAPPCRYAGECGGCNWQHLTEDAQREQKQLLVRETLEKFLPGRELPLLPLVPSPRVLDYRNRVQPQRQGNRLGYRKRRSHDFLAVDDCPIVEEPLKPIFRRPPPGPDARLELRLTPEGDVVVVEPGDETGFAFAQVNRFQNEDLIRTVLDWAGETKPSAIWDLYAGAGNFSFPLAGKYAGVPVTAVELSDVLVKQGRAEAAKRRDRGTKFLVSDVGSWLRRRIPPHDSLIVIDPPRAGAGAEVMAALRASGAKQIILIGCHPVSLARDLADLLKDARWALERVQAFEMFPQTDHVETIAQVRVRD